MNAIVLGTILRAEEKSIIAALKSKGFKTIFIQDKNFDIDDLISFSPDVIINRVLSSSKAERLAALCEYAGILTINSSRAIQICADKARQAVLFNFNRIPVPHFKIFQSANALKENASELYPFVLKPCNGSWGRGLSLINSASDLDIWLSSREGIDPNHNKFPILAQKYIDKDNFDIRLLVFGNQAVVAFKRISDNWRTNTTLGAKIVPIELTEPLTKLASQCVSILGLGIYGVDIIIDKNTHENFICEINHNFDFSKSSLIHGVNIADEIVKYTIERIQNNGYK